MSTQQKYIIIMKKKKKKENLVFAELVMTKAVISKHRRHSGLNVNLDDTWSSMKISILWFWQKLNTSKTNRLWGTNLINVRILLRRIKPKCAPFLQQWNFFEKQFSYRVCTKQSFCGVVGFISLVNNTKNALFVSKWFSLVLGSVFPYESAL